MDPVHAQPTVNVAVGASLNVIATQSPDEATTANTATVSPSSPLCTGFLEDYDGSPAPPLPPTADLMLNLNPGETPNNTSEPAPTPIHPLLQTAGSGASDTSGAICPLLATAENNTFDCDGIHKDFINKAVVTYWETVPGGGRWIEMIQSYLTLLRLPQAKGVSSSHCSFLGG